MSKTYKKSNYKERRSNRSTIKSKGMRQKTRADKITDDEFEPSNYGEYLGEDGYRIDQETGQKKRVDRLREWIMKQRYIPQDLPDEFLTLFLSAADFNVEDACEKMKKYFFTRQEAALFRNRDPFEDENDNILEKLYVVPMPGITKMGKKIIMTGLCHPIMTYSLFQHAKLLSLVLDLLIWENDFGFGDFVVVLNGNGFTCPQLLQNEVHSHRSITSLLLDTIPGTLRAFYLVSPPPHVVNVAKNRNGISIIVVKKPEKMSDYLGPDNLPQEYGGNLKSFSKIKESWLQHFLDKRKLWVNFEKTMTSYYRRRLCYEEDKLTGGKNWVQKIKLEADEWEYKTKYYEKMKNLQPMKHPAFGFERLRNLRNLKYIPPPKTSFEIFKSQLTEEIDDESTGAGSYRDSEIRKGKVEDQERKNVLNCCTSFCPILELEIRY